MCLTQISLFENNSTIELNGKETEDEATKKKQLLNINFKFPFICSEILNCQVYKINDTLAKDPRLLGLLLSYLSRRKVYAGKLINSCCDTYFLKAMYYFMKRYFFEVAISVIENEQFVDDVLDNLDMFDLDFFLLTLFGLTQDVLDDLYLPADQLKELFEEQQRQFSMDVSEIHLKVQKLFLEKGFIRRCLESPKGLRNVLALFTKIQGKTCMMNLEIENKETFHILIDLAIKDHDLLKDVVGYIENYLVAWRIGSESEEKRDVSETLKYIVSRTKDLMDLIPQTSDDLTTSGGKVARFGETGLFVVSHLRALTRIPYSFVQQMFIDLGVFTKLMDLFVRYPLNNILHNLVMDIFINVIRFDGSLELKKNLIFESKICERILSVVSDCKWSRVQLYEVANSIVVITHKEKYLFIEEYCTRLTGWIDFVIGDLTNYNDLATKIIGGTSLSMGYVANIQEQIVEQERIDFSPDEDEGNDDEPKNVLNVVSSVTGDDDFDAEFDSAFI